MRHINEEGIEHVKRWEGLRLRAYLCSAGVWTIGYGHTSDENLKVTKGLEIDEAEADRLLRLDIQEAERAVAGLVKVPLGDNQFAALVSFVFNVGIGAFKKSTLLRKLNEGDFGAVPAQMMRWTKAGGKHVEGLANRRAAEVGLWSKGSFVASKDVAVKPAPEPAASRGTGVLEGLVGGAGVGGAADLLLTGGDTIEKVGAAPLPVQIIVGGVVLLVTAGLVWRYVVGAKG